jgi:3-oxoacyl-[acyl-carrier-protein] synthase-3
MTIRSVIAATGSYVPLEVIPNSRFRNHAFYGQDGKKLEKANEEIIRRFEQITGIRERRYVPDGLLTSDIAALAAEDALVSSGMDRETLDGIIVAHNFGDVRPGGRRSEMVPSLAARVKQKLGVVNSATAAWDIPFGCPGWLQGMIQADCAIRAGDARRVLVVGAEILSRVSDPHDRDSMLYADGAGAAVLEAREADNGAGVLAHAVRSDTREEAYFLWMGRSSNPECEDDGLFLKMRGHELYEYALRTVPAVVLDCLRKAGLALDGVRKVLIHQANAKMDEAIGRRLYKLCGMDGMPDGVMPMTISWLGNSSVATLPTLLDLILKKKIEGQRLEAGDTVLFASVGAGMNINAMAYRFPSTMKGFGKSSLRALQPRPSGADPWPSGGVPGAPGGMPRPFGQGRDGRESPPAPVRRAPGGPCVLAFGAL